MKQDVSVFAASWKLSDNYPRFLTASWHLPSALVYFLSQLCSISKEPRFMAYLFVL